MIYQWCGLVVQCFCTGLSNHRGSTVNSKAWAEEKTSAVRAKRLKSTVMYPGVSHVESRGWFDLYTVHWQILLHEQGRSLGLIDQLNRNRLAQIPARNSTGTRSIRRRTSRNQSRHTHHNHHLIRKPINYSVGNQAMILSGNPLNTW